MEALKISVGPEGLSPEQAAQLDSSLKEFKRADLTFGNGIRLVVAPNWRSTIQDYSIYITSSKRGTPGYDREIAISMAVGLPAFSIPDMAPPAQILGAKLYKELGLPTKWKLSFDKLDRLSLEQVSRCIPLAHAFEMPPEPVDEPVSPRENRRYQLLALAQFAGLDLCAQIAGLPNVETLGFLVPAYGIFLMGTLDKTRTVQSLKAMGLAGFAMSFAIGSFVCVGHWAKEYIAIRDAAYNQATQKLGDAPAGKAEGLVLVPGDGNRMYAARYKFTRPESAQQGPNRSCETLTMEAADRIEDKALLPDRPWEPAYFLNYFYNKGPYQFCTFDR